MVSIFANVKWSSRSCRNSLAANHR